MTTALERVKEAKLRADRNERDTVFVSFDDLALLVALADAVDRLTDASCVQHDYACSFYTQHDKQAHERDCSCPVRSFDAAFAALQKESP